MRSTAIIYHFAGPLLLSLCGLGCTPEASSQPVSRFFGLSGFDRSNAIIQDGNEGYFIAGSSDSDESTEGWIYDCATVDSCSKIVSLTDRHLGLVNLVVFDLVQ
jgi:hypothetical protein